MPPPQKKKQQQQASSSSGLSARLKDLQNHRDAGLISQEEYRRRASAAVQDGQLDLERKAALSNNANIQSLTGAVGVMVETHCKETWQQALFKRWAEVQHKRAILVAAFVVLVIMISAFSFVDEGESVDTMIDRGAGAHEALMDADAMEAGLEAAVDAAGVIAVVGVAAETTRPPPGGDEGQQEGAAAEAEGDEENEGASAEPEAPLEQFEAEPGEPETQTEPHHEGAVEETSGEEKGGGDGGRRL